MNLPDWMERRSRTRGGPRVDVADRIARRSKRVGECLIWTGVVSQDGYGQIGIGRGKSYRTHRIAWELVNGPIPEGRLVCHSCDMPLCVNVEHLFLGTPKDNTRDMLEKGRRPFLAGEFHPSVKLTDSQVAEIIERRSSGEKLASIAADYGIHWGYVSNLFLNGRKPTSKEAPCHSSR
jgi:hypothetical protein